MSGAVANVGDVADVEASTHRSVNWVGGAERYGLAVIVCGLIVFFGLFGPTADVFPTALNMRNVLGNESAAALLAIGALVPLSAGQFDLSIGANAGLSAVAAAAAVSRFDIPTPAALAVGVIFAAGIGALNGVLVVGWSVPSLIATLGTSSLIAGLVSWYTSGNALIANIPASIKTFGSGRWLGLPRPLFVVAAVGVVVHTVIEHTPAGRRLAMTGENATAAALVGVRVRRQQFMSFVVSGGVAGLAGLIVLCRAASANPQVGPNFTLPALSAAFLGATAIRPGRFNVPGTVLGVGFVAVSVNGLTLAGVKPWVQPVFNGAALLMAVALSLYASRRNAGRSR
jgi:ribose transport system permease protein